MVLSHKILVFPFLTLEQHTTFSFCQSHRWSILNQSFASVISKRDLRRSGYILLFMANYPFIIHIAFWKESMINRLSNIINRNRWAAKMSQVLCSTNYPILGINYDENSRNRRRLHLNI